MKSRVGGGSGKIITKINILRKFETNAGQSPVISLSPVIGAKVGKFNQKICRPSDISLRPPKLTAIAQPKTLKHTQSLSNYHAVVRLSQPSALVKIVWDICFLFCFHCQFGK